MEQPASCRLKRQQAPRRSQQDLAFHPDAGDHPERQIFLDIASQMRSMTDEYASAKKQIMAWRRELLEYLDEQQLDLIVLTAGILGMSASAVGAATLLPVVSGRERREAGVDNRAQSQSVS